MVTIFGNRVSGKNICEEDHIIFSALYVVDLVKFREIAVGDQLRVFYETLGKGPVFLIWMRTFQTVPSIQYPSFHSHNNGCGASHAVVMQLIEGKNNRSLEQSND